MEKFINSNVHVFESADGLARSTAVDATALLNDFIKNKGTATIVLSGGETPKSIYSYIGSSLTDKVDWSKVYFFWGDERCVQPEDEQSNFGSANSNLLSRIDVPARNIFRVKGELPPHQAAVEYEEELKKFFRGQRLPSFDVVLLGIGSDGHTASLFAGGKAIEEKEKWVTDEYVEKLDSWRITLTIPVLNNSKNVLFIARGKEKSGIIRKILNNEDSTMPAGMINPHNGILRFYLDKDSAGE